MNVNPNLIEYDQVDVEQLYISRSIVPNIDDFSNLIVKNASGNMFDTSITIPLTNIVYIPIKVETAIHPEFNEL